MLLLLLSFYVYYDLLNCEEIVTAKVSESLLVDHQRRNLLQVNTLLQDLEQKTRKLSALLSDDYPYITRREETYFLRSKISGKDQNNQNPKDSTKPATFLPYPQYDPFANSQVTPSVISPGPIGLVALKNPDVKPGNRLPDHYLKPLLSTYPGLNVTPSLLPRKGPVLFTSNFLHQVSTSTPRPLLQQVTSTPLSSTPSPVFYPTPYNQFQSFNSASPTSMTQTVSLGQIAKIWFQEIAPYTPAKHKLRKASIDQPHPYKEGTTVSIPPRMTELTSYRSSTGIGKTTQQFKEDKHGFPNVTFAKKVGRPETPEDPYINWTTPEDVLHGKIEVKKPSTLPPNQRYQDLMDQLNERYLMVFGMEMFRLIAVKDKRGVQQLLAPIEKIYNATLKSGRLVKADNPFLTVFGMLAKMTSGDDIDALRTYSSMMFHALLKRKQVLPPEVNSIIDQAGLFYSDEEGKRLLHSLSQFEDYPNTTKSSYSICESLIASLLQPFRLPAYSKTRQGLLSSINKALRQNFPLLLRDGSVGTLAEIGRLLPRIGSQPRKRKKKHHHKKKRKRKRRPKYNTTYNSQDLDYKDPWFRPITTKRYRTIDRRPTPAFLPLDHLDAQATNVLQRLRSKQMKKLLRES